MERKVLVMVVVGLFLVGSSWCASNPQSKSINAALRAPWSGTPLLMEAGELLSKYDKENFWSLVDKWSSEELSDLSANKDCFGRILHVGRSILKGPLESVFHLSLMLRIASPKLLVYRQLAQESLLKHQTISEQKVPDGGIAPPQTSFQLGKQVTSLDRWSISSNPLGSGNKCCWVDVGSNILVDESELITWLNNAKEMKPDLEEIEIFEFDHTYPGFSSSKTVAVLYGALGTSCFHSFHSHLAGASKQGLLRYIFRPVLPSGCEKSAHKCSAIGASDTIYLGGYGVELALKNMEYKAIDDSDTKKGGTFEDAQNDDLNNEVRGFIFSKLLERKPDLARELVAFRDYLLSSGTSDTLNAWELKDLGYQTAQMILHASEPLQLMQEINQNFPNLASSLSRMRLNETVKEEISRNQRIISPGNNLLALNGALLNPENIDLYSLIDLVFGELSVADAITKVKVPSKFIKSFMQIPDPSDEHLFRLDFRSDHHVHYLNNLEKDSMYKRWRSNLQELLMPVFPGQLRYVRKNLYHAVYVIDPASSAGLEVVETIIQYHSDSVPMRFGLIMVSTECLKSIMENEGDSLKFASESSENQEDVSSLIFRLFLHLKHNYGSVTAFQFLVNVNKVKGGDSEVPEEEVVEITHVEEAFYEILKSKAKVPPEEILSQLEKGTEYKDQVMQSSLFVYKLGLSHMLPCLLMNGLFFGPSQVESAALTAMNEELPRIQEAVYYGQIKYNTDVLDKFLKENGYTRYNPQFFVKAKDQKHVSLLDVTEKGSILAELKFLHSPGSEDDIKSVTHLVVVDVHNFHGFSLLQQAIRYLVIGSTRGRVGILFNVPSPTKPSQHLILLKALMASLNLSSRRSKVPPFLQRLLSWYKANVLSQLANAAALESEEIAANIINLADSMGVKIGLSQNDLVEPVSGDWLKNRLLKEEKFVLSQLGLKSGSNAVITNGKVFVQEKDKLFVAEDFSLVESMEVKRRGKPIVELIEKVEWEGIEPDELTSDFLSNAIMAISSIMAMRNRGSENARFDVLQSDCSAVIRQPEHSVVHIDAVIDPLSSVGQRITPLLVLLQDWFQPSMQIFMNPMDSVAELPLKNFYRYVVPRKDAFIEDGWLQSGPKAVFLNMPLSKTLTMNLDVPEPWLVEPVKAIYDLDNIVLEKLGEEKSMYAVFELEALMLTGHCFERNKDPPRGLQLLLGTRLHQHMVDTIVMANLGYWQLKAAPGIWTLRLAPGRSSALYTFDGPGEGTDSGPLFKRVVIKDLRGEVVHLEVIKRKGKEHKNVLDLDAEGYDKSSDLISAEADSNFMKWATELITGSKESQDANGKDKANGRLVARQGETVNIFSVASGHLYERFLKIMILSVLKNTRRPVKFWFIKNYLSPQFKDVIPLMAKYYGFDYELVTYKWPTWLHKQTEKQRLIWAYKILFLDVLFPLSLKKVIFVDADQIVRADMGDLYDLDIKGKPLAYTPFCNNNKDMDGYRFWKQGFWKDHLRGKPYHISALYVVDLVKFRQTAAGDTLRVVYETLSKDPGSLANLDQDLPNYAQHTVPIFSLPQEWLWCESWCGNSTKSKAKTIDLCNNPMTKEPKLEAALGKKLVVITHDHNSMGSVDAWIHENGAKRIVSEWLSLDLEAREVTDRVAVGAEDGQNNPVSVTISEDNDADRESASEL